MTCSWSQSGPRGSPGACENALTDAAFVSDSHMIICGLLIQLLAQDLRWMTVAIPSCDGASKG